jgi:hypothetical protein
LMSVFAAAGNTSIDTQTADAMTMPLPIAPSPAFY